MFGKANKVQKVVILTTKNSLSNNSFCSFVDKKRVKLCIKMPF